MSQFSYNSIQLQFIKTDSIERTPNWSDDGTEYKWTDFSISFSAIYNPAATSYNVLGQQGGILPMTTDSSIRHQLMQPRRPLFYSEGGQNIISIQPSGSADGSAIDCKNGPIPQYCTVTRIASSRLFYVNYSIKCAIIECPTSVQCLVNPSNPGDSLPIASSRYSRKELINDQYLSTLTTSGVTYFRSNAIAALGKNADAFRGYMIPVPLLGYHRKEVSVGLSSDGLKVEWSTTDQEVIVDIGNLDSQGSAGSTGIVDMDMDYKVANLTRSSLGIAGMGSIATVNVWAKGMKGSNTYNMILYCFATAWAKLTNVTPLGMLSACELSEKVFKHEINISLSYIVLDDVAGFGDAHMPIFGVVGVPVGTIQAGQVGQNPVPPWENATRGTLGYQLAISSLATACCTTYENVGIDSMGSQYPPGLNVNNPQDGLGTPVVNFYQIPNNPAPVSSGNSLRSVGLGPPRNSLSIDNNGILQYKAMYFEYIVVASYGTNSGIITLPVATGNNQGSQSSGNPTPASCVNIQLFQPMSKASFYFKIVRIGSPPEIPTPDIPQSITNQNGNTVPNPNYGNMTLLTYNVDPMGVETMPDGYTIVYRIEGTYTYSYLNPLNSPNPNQSSGNTQQTVPLAVVPFAIPPWVNVQANIGTNTIPSDYNNTIINNPTYIS